MRICISIYDYFFTFFIRVLSLYVGEFVNTLYTYTTLFNNGRRYRRKKWNGLRTTSIDQTLFYFIIYNFHEYQFKMHARKNLLSFKLIQYTRSKIFICMPIFPNKKRERVIKSGAAGINESITCSQRQWTSLFWSISW